MFSKLGVLSLADAKNSGMLLDVVVQNSGLFRSGKHVTKHVLSCLLFDLGRCWPCVVASHHGISGSSAEDDWEQLVRARLHVMAEDFSIPVLQFW